MFLWNRLVLISCLMTGSLFAQTATVHGFVKDSSGKAVELAVVLIENTRFAVSTDEKGAYLLSDIPPGNYVIRVKLLGYAPSSNTIRLSENENLILDWTLNAGTHLLNEVQISGIHVLTGMGHQTEVLDGVIYSGKKTEVLLPDSLNANTALNNPRQILGRVPGANYSETEGGGFPSSGVGFRGLNPTQSIEVNIRQNGYNVSADLYGYPESYYLPPMEAVERIEVTRGASSLQFGPQFGGVINYITRSGPKNKAFEFQTEQTGGSFGLFNSFNVVGGTIRNLNYYAYVQGKTQDGWRPNSDLKQIPGFAKLEWHPLAPLTLGLEYSMLRNRIHMPGGLSDDQFNADSRASFRSRNWLTSPWNILALTGTLHLTGNTQLSLKSALNISERSLVWKNEDGGPARADSISPLTGTYVQREVQREAFVSSTTELRLLSKYKLGDRDQLLAGGVRFFTGTMHRQGGGPGSTGSDFDLNLYGGTYDYDLNFQTLNLAGFVENTFHAGNRLSITPGYRFEYLKSTASGYVTDPDLPVRVRSDRSQERTIPLGGLGFQLKTTPTSDLYANISQAYRPTDYSNQTPLGVSSRIDPNLKDASGFNADLGWRGSFRNFLTFDVGGFYLAYNNRIGIITLTDAQGNPYTYRTNVANSVHQGVETYVEFNPFKLGNVPSRFGSFSLFNSFAGIDAHYSAGVFAGNRVEFAPRQIERLGITYTFRKVSTTFQVSYTSSSFGDANNTVYSPNASVGVIPAYTVMDWSLTYRFRNYHLKCGINNLGGASYFTLRTDEYPGPGIIPSAGPSAYLGIGARF